ncbi:Mov34/MPN/PAD-1 family protein [Acidipila sp. EB88]|uniref:Mov34/MPN/PAD-1 family protein n=1 Tax=Acidipila sp. EB88 TaxID=2305226 RepID=UPI000F5E3432|nr:M67 family metallopeptidase [Acidipila sp. EB88]RRA48544.1 M67 family peptidase [Acidipila sp. EB88]
MLKVSQLVLNTLRAHGEETYPHECCGVLLGHSAADGNTVEAAVPAGNTRTDSAHNRYHIAPGELIRVQREARALGFDIVGFYHSHPDHPAQWSQTDFAEAHWIGCSYVITAVEQGKAQRTNSFRLEGTTEEDKHFVDESVHVQAAETQQPDNTAAATESSAGRC